MRARPSLLWHRWFGVLAGAWLFVVALTGCALVFYGELDRALNPELFRAPAVAAGETPRVAAAMREAERRWPGSHAGYAALPHAPGDAIRLYLSDRPDAPGAVGPAGREVFADPGTGRVLGSRVFGAWTADRAHLMPWLYKLHYELHGGAWLYWLLGWVALLWFADHAVAAALALGSAKRWADAFRLRRGARGHKRVFDLHRAVGVWLLPVTATLAFTGVYFNLHGEFRAVLDRVSAPAPDPAERAPALSRALHQPPVDADAALGAVRTHLPGASPSSLGYDGAKGLWTVRLHDARDVIADHGERAVTLDARSGRVLADRHWRDGTAGDAVMAWQYPLHSGKAFGWAGRILVLLAGLATCTLVATGYLVWWRKLRARRAHAARARPAAIGALQPAE